MGQRGGVGYLGKRCARSGEGRGRHGGRAEKMMRPLRRWSCGLGASEDHGERIKL